MSSSPSSHPTLLPHYGTKIRLLPSILLRRTQAAKNEPKSSFISKTSPHRTRQGRQTNRRTRRQTLPEKGPQTFSGEEGR